MDYRQSRIVIFTIPNGLEVSGNQFWGWTFIPRLVLQRVKLSLQKVPIHIKQKDPCCDKHIERELIILPYFNGYYEELLGERFKDQDPIHAFVNDVDQVILQKSDAVVWIFTTGKNVKPMMHFFSSITTDIVLYEEIGQHDTYAVASFPKAFAA